MPDHNNSTVRWNANNATQTGDMPTGISQGDLLMAVIVSDETTYQIDSNHGYQCVADVRDTGGTRMSVWLKYAGASETACTFTLNTGVDCGVSVTRITAPRARDLGLDLVRVVTSSGSNVPTVTIPGGDTEADNSLIIVVGYDNSSNGINTPTNFSEAFDSTGASPTSTMALFHRKQAVAGATGDVVLNDTTAQNSRWSAVMLAFTVAEAVLPRRPRITGLLHRTFQSTASLTTPIPANTPEGAPLYAFVGRKFGDTISNSNSWTHLGNIEDGTSHRVSVWRKYAGASEGSAQFTTTNSGDVHQVLVVRLAPTHPTSPHDKFSGQATAGGNTDTITVTGFSTVDDLETLLYYAGFNGTTMPFALPSGIFRRADWSGLSTGWTSFLMDGVQAVAGATGNKTLALDGSGRRGDALIAVRPDNVGPAPPTGLTAEAIFE